MSNITKPSLEEIEKAIVDRDEIDAKIDQESRKNLIENGLSIIEPKRVIKIDTGEVVGVSNVVNIIKEQISDEINIIAVEGESGCGKSSTVSELAKALNGCVISVSNIFRYLTFCELNNLSDNVDSTISRLGLKLFNNKVCLFDSGKNISVDANCQLHTHQIDTNVASVASRSQLQVVSFLQKEINNLSNDLNSKIIFEGRAFTLDFLPCDLRVILYADIKVRAERRLKQER